jgi:uncharacterized protein with HEPN domain
MMRDPALLLKDIHAACGHIVGFVSGMDYPRFAADVKTSSATIRQLEIIGEAARGIPEDIKSAHPEIHWRDMAAMRDRLIHGYAGVDLKLVWETVQTDIPALHARIGKLL